MGSYGAARGYVAHTNPLYPYEYSSYGFSEPPQSTTPVRVNITTVYPQYPLAPSMMNISQMQYDNYVEQYRTYYQSSMTWTQYCHYLQQQMERRDPNYDDDYEPPRHSVWF